MLPKLSTTHFQGRIVRVDVEQVTLPNGVPCELEIIHHPGGAAAVAVDDSGEVCVLRQYRHAIGGWLWELPAGKIDAAEDHAETARRELHEEAGVRANEWHYLGDMISSPGMFTERVHLYLATGLVRGAHARDDDEVLETHWMAFDDACAMAEDGRIADAKTAIGLLRARAALSGHGAG